MYTISTGSDYLRRGGSNFDENTQSYYRVHGGRRSNFDPMSLPAKVYWSSARQRNNGGSTGHETEGRHEGDLWHESDQRHVSLQRTAGLQRPQGDDREGESEYLLQLRRGAFQPPTSRSPTALPWLLRSAAAVPQPSPTSSQVIRSEPRRFPCIFADGLIASQQRRSGGLPTACGGPRQPSLHAANAATE